MFLNKQIEVFWNLLFPLETGYTPSFLLIFYTLNYGENDEHLK